MWFSGAGYRLLPPLLPPLLSLLCAPSLAEAVPSAGRQNHHMHSDWSLHDNEYVLAYINVTYGDPATGGRFHQGGEIGKFSTGLVASARGQLVHVRSKNGTAHHGCDQEWENTLPSPPQTWVALIRRGLCNFDVKVENAYRNNASAVIIYDYKEGDLHRIHLTRRHRDTIVTVFIPKKQGDDLVRITDSGVDVALQITPGKHFSYASNNLNKTSVLFVSVSFILLMVISLAWLLFYYVQRFRYMHARDQLTKRLVCAAKKAVSRIPVKLLKTGDDQLTEGECCAVCLEPYRVSDQLRSLPCSHEFHKQCVDPWLLKNRTCPMCKMDILKYFGLSSVSEESIVQLELEEASAVRRRSSLLSPTLYVSSQPSGGAAGRSRSVSRASLQSMSLVLPSPACVESLHARSSAAGGAAARCRRVSAILATSHWPEPPRRSSAPPSRSPVTSLIHEPLGRSLSSPAGPVAAVAIVAGSVADTANEVSQYGVLSPPPWGHQVQTAMCRRCQRPGRTGGRRSPRRASSGSSSIAEGAVASCSSPDPSLENSSSSAPDSTAPTDPGASCDPPPTGATSTDSDGGAACDRTSQHGDGAIQAGSLTAAGNCD